MRDLRQSDSRALGESISQVEGRLATPFKAVIFNQQSLNWWLGLAYSAELFSPTLQLPKVYSSTNPQYASSLVVLSSD